MYFPKTRGANLQRQKKQLPVGLGASLNLVMVAFQQWQQSLVDSWIPFVENLEAEWDDLRYYELPVLPPMNFLARTFINEGMRAGIPNKKARNRTITLYLDKEKFRQTLAIPSEDDIYLLLLDRQGKVHWRSEGSYTPEKGQDLKRFLESRNLEPALLGS